MKFPNKKESKETPKIKEGVDFVFEQNPELENIGTKEQYSEYLDTIFPESKVKYVVFKGLREDFFNENKPSFFTSDKDAAKYYSSLVNRKEVISAILDFKNPLIVDAEKPAPISILDKMGITLGTFSDKDINEKILAAGYDGLVINRKFSSPLDGWEILTFGNMSRYILGSQIDIEKFKTFVANQEEKKDN